jgi:phosphotransferase system HPr (HPr) family protein
MIGHDAGLHARPAALFVKTANLFPCKITVRNMTKDKPPVNAKSILSVLTQGAGKGTKIEIVAEGERADEAIAALKDLIDTNFGE